MLAGPGAPLMDEGAVLRPVPTLRSFASAGCADGRVDSTGLLI